MLRWPEFVYLVDVSDIFYFSRRGGEGGVRGARRGGGSVFFFFIENPRRGGVFRRGSGQGAVRVSAANWGIFLGGRLNIFFRGRNVHQV